MKKNEKEEVTISQITVIDSIMGSGKTSWSIQYINENPDENILYITPFLEEVDRIINNTNKSFKQPRYMGGSKLENLNQLLTCQCDIATTHELFKRLTNESKEAIKEGNYTLILDEVLAAIDPYDDIRKDDMKLLIKSEAVSIDDDGFIVWNKDMSDYDTSFNRIKILAENRSLLYVNKRMLIWRYPPEVFRLFNKVYIMTYMFDASILKNYFNLYGIDYVKKSIKCNNDGMYQILDYYKPNTRIYANLINVYEGKLNENIEQKMNGLSLSWFRAQDESEPEESLIPQLKKNIYNYFRNIVDARSNTIMWTTFKDYRPKLKGSGYSKQFTSEQLKNTDKAYGFLPCNARSVNRYGDCYNLAYCLNTYLHPAISQFFKQKGIAINENLYGLSEMLQWIWRSRIRNGENINIYIPSKRMRSLLISWMNDKYEIGK